MSLPNQLIVSGAGLAAVNGTYIRGGTGNLSSISPKLASPTRFGKPIWYNLDSIIYNDDEPPGLETGYSIFYDANNNYWGIYEEQYFNNSYDSGAKYVAGEGIEGVALSETPLAYEFVANLAQAPAPTVTAFEEGGGGGGSSSLSVKIAENTKIKFQGKVKII